MMKLYNNPQSRSLTLLPLLKELQIEDQIEQVEVAYEHMHQQAYTRINPMGKVPCLVDQGVIISERPPFLSIWQINIVTKDWHLLWMIRSVGRI